jgi:ATP-dependent Clp protease, protease subunit
MTNKILHEETIPISNIDSQSTIPQKQLLHYFGRVGLEKNERLFTEIKQLMQKSPAEIYLTVSSSGGPSGAGMCFFDMITKIVRPRLITIGTGDVDSSGILIFLSGERRWISRNTTLLLHPAGRYFDNDHRYTAEEISAMVAEDRLKDEQYAAIVADRSTFLSQGEVLDMMRTHRVLKPEDLLAFGLAEKII